MKECVFCKIARGELESVTLWDDKNTLALLDARPNTPGMTLVITKNHYKSDIFELSDDVYLELMRAVKKVTRLLKRGLNVKRVAVVVEGLEINHAHVKLYPIYGLDSAFEEKTSKDTADISKYEGFITTKFGPKADLISLRKLAKKIKSKL